MLFFEEEDLLWRETHINKIRACIWRVCRLPAVDGLLNTYE